MFIDKMANVQFMAIYKKISLKLFNNRSDIMTNFRIFKRAKYFPQPDYQIFKTSGIAKIRRQGYELGTRRK